jgi:adenylate kinase family enzyme
VKRIHVLGASGAGTTTLGKAAAAALGAESLDTRFVLLAAERSALSTAP